MLARVRNFVAGPARWLRAHAVIVTVALLACAAAVVSALFAAGELGGDDDPVTAPAPEVIVRTEEVPEETEELGFPAFATRNTTRIASDDSVATAAAAALAAFPARGGVEGPAAVSLVEAADWPAGVAAASLVADPVSAPVLLTDGGELPDLTRQALAQLGPEGSAATNDRALFAIGTQAPGGLSSQEVTGQNPAEIAAAVARLRERLAGEPDHLLIASSDEPGYAMPAAAWAARSGDPVLYAQRDSVPAPTLQAIEQHDRTPVYLLGPEDVISKKAEAQIERATKAPVKRASEGDDPVASAIEFARYVDGDFGWNINDPGHGFVLASTSRPADAGAAAPLSASGSWGPLLVTATSRAPAPELEGYLLDLKPGYEDDPTRAVYNHIWVIGDESTISVDFQAAIDEIVEVAPVRGGSGSGILGPPPGTPEPERRGEGTGAQGGADRQDERPRGGTDR